VQVATPRAPGLPQRKKFAASPCIGRTGALDCILYRLVKEMTRMPSLFDPVQLGAITAPNRILMAPLTRGRATRDHVPTDIMVEYYRQRAGAGLIISEATGISAEGLGWPYAPGIWNDEQVAGWRKVTAAVHEAGGRIVLQLWHMGRIVHSSVTGVQPVSSSATTGPGQAHTYDGKKPFEEARPLETAEIPRLLADYAHAARNAIAAGFDGVQIHAANGYLIDQFLRDNSNFRTDAYGGSIENRVRLLREVAGAVVGAIGGDRVGVRLSPNGDSQGVNDSAPHDLFPAAAAALADAGVAWLELREPDQNGTFGKGEVAPVAPAIKQAFGGPLVLNSDYDDVTAQAALDAGAADAIAFGRPFIANPDLPHRYANNLPIAPDTMATWYSRGIEGYIDYPAYQEAAAA
jgi:2,4-dienoyl-CoA reductase-like NADH-dependent reductase (Old Yellow Enzyme family)